MTDLLNGKMIRLTFGPLQITRFPIPWLSASPHSVAVGADGTVWFSSLSRGSIGKLVPSTGQFRRFPTPTPASVPHGIIVDSRGLVWFAELDGNKLGVLIPQRFNRIVELDVPTANADPYFVAEAPNGEIWFTEAAAPFLGRLPCTAGR